MSLPSRLKYHSIPSTWDLDLLERSVNRFGAAVTIRSLPEELVALGYNGPAG